ncbi:DUF433 domain-containing protein [Afifella pfennigii]|uniref:DUF433 domain-containing protein n=1 Tax=Afifella pfennigii TaxID=209897 RepID=UPI00068FE13B|nr:DUF433 domain-containing protein [Afifella pfennigii]
MARLTGLSKGQLRAWDRSDFFSPRYAYEDRRSAYSRVYSFRDVVGLRTIAVLMKEHRVSVQKLRKVADELVRRGYDNWAEIKLYVVKGDVHFRPPGSEDVEGVFDGQLAMVPVIDVISDVEERVLKMKRRPQSQHGRIEKHKYVLRNAPVLAGTRIPTAAIQRFHEAGYSIKQIIHEYPSLTKKDVEAALAYEERLASSA